MGENDENKPSNEQGQLPSYEQSIQIPEDDKPELPPAYRFVQLGKINWCAWLGWSKNK